MNAGVLAKRLAVLGDILPYSAAADDMAAAVNAVERAAPCLYPINLGREFRESFARCQADAGVPDATIAAALSAEATERDRRNLRLLAGRAWAEVVRYVNGNRYGFLLHGAECLTVYGLDVAESVAMFHGLRMRCSERAGESGVLLVADYLWDDMVRATGRIPTPVVAV